MYAKTQWVSGVLICVPHSRVCVLRSGDVDIPCLLLTIASETVMPLHEQKVKVRGKAYYDHHHRPLCIDALEVSPSDDYEHELYALRKPVRYPEKPVSLVGTWMGDETDEDIEAFLKTL